MGDELFCPREQADGLAFGNNSPDQPSAAGRQFPKDPARRGNAATATKIKAPVLAINGQYGHPGVREQMQLVAENVCAVTLANLGHLCAEEKPDEFAAELDVAPAPMSSVNELTISSPASA